MAEEDCGQPHFHCCRVHMHTISVSHTCVVLYMRDLFATCSIFLFESGPHWIRSTLFYLDTPTWGKCPKLFFKGYKPLQSCIHIRRRKYLGLVSNKALASLLGLFVILCVRFVFKDNTCVYLQFFVVQHCLICTFSGRCLCRTFPLKFSALIQLSAITILKAKGHKSSVMWVWSNLKMSEIHIMYSSRNM